MSAVATRLQARENPEIAAMTEAVVNDWRTENALRLGKALQLLSADRLSALRPEGKTLTPQEEAKINETYDGIEALYKSANQPIRR
jgi:hypothetical protein